MAVPAVGRLVYLLAPFPLKPRSTPIRTGGTPVPLSKNPKASGFWDKGKGSQKVRQSVTELRAQWAKLCHNGAI